MGLENIVSDVSEVNLDAAFVGRTPEFETVKQNIDKAKTGEGNLTLIKGEAGVGKTRFSLEAINYARENGLNVLTGRCLQEGATPFLPFTKILDKSGLKHLMSTEQPRVENVYIVMNDGRLLAENKRTESDLDSDIFAGMLNAVENFMADSLKSLGGNGGELHAIAYGKYRILIEKGENISLAVLLSGTENEFLKDDMKEKIREIKESYGKVLESWNGEMSAIAGVKEITEPLIEKYKGGEIAQASENQESKRLMLFEQITQGLVEYAKKTPAILLIDDLQWADSHTLNLLQYIARNLKKSNISMMTTYRSEEIPRVLEDALEKISRERLGEKLELGRLDKESVRDMIESIYKATGKIPEEFVDAVYEHTNGNPFFVEEVLRTLEENKIINSLDVSSFKKVDLDAIKIPEKIQDLVNRRLKNLSEEDRELLEWAAVIGNNFAEGLLGEVSETSYRNLGKCLRRCHDSRILKNIKGEEWIFDHSEIRNIIYGELRDRELKEMHETVGLALDKEKEKHAAAEIAHHFNKAVNEKSGKETLEKAVEYNILAGDAAAKLFATDIALQHYRNALPLLQRLEAKEKEMDVLVKALNFSQKTDYNLTRDLAATLLEAAIKTGDEQKQAEAYGFLAYVESKQGNKRGAIDILQKELEIAERNKFSLNAIRANRRVGVNYKELGEYEKAIEYINKAFAEIGKKQITSEEKEFENKLIYEEAALNNILGLIKVEQGEHDDAYEFYKKSLKLYEKINNIFEIPLSYNNIGTIHHKKGNYNAALEEYLKGFEIVQKNKDVPYLSLIATNISDIYQRTMELDKAEEYAAIALESAEKVGAPHLIARSFFIYGDIYRQRGDWKNASKKYHESLDRIRAGNRPVVFASYLEEAAGYFKEFNEPKQAQKLYNEALEIFQKVGNEKKMREITEKLKEF